jgi:hypothetical protein
LILFWIQQRRAKNQPFGLKQSKKINHMAGETVEIQERVPKPKGGKRAGAGRKPGWSRKQDAYLNGVLAGVLPVETLTKDAAREFTRRTIIEGLAPLLRAQLAHAQGIGHCYTRDKNGKFSRVDNLDKIDELLMTGTEGEHFFIFAKDPSAVAFKELLDRALDKPKEQAQEVHVTGEIELFTRLAAARQRVIDVTTTPALPSVEPSEP